MRRKQAALVSLFDHLLENNAVSGGNPVHDFKRRGVETSEGQTLALGNDQVKLLLDVSKGWTLRGIFGRTILAVLRCHGLRWEKPRNRWLATRKNVQVLSTCR